MTAKALGFRWARSWGIVSRPLADTRGEADFANEILSAMRYQFGGHLEKADEKFKVA